MEITNAIISNALAAVENEIARLDEVRSNLSTLLEEFVVEQPKATRPKGVRSTKQAKVTTRKSTKQAVEPKVTRRDQIIELLEEDWSPREIADELGIKPNYVYHVKADLITA